MPKFKICRKMNVFRPLPFYFVNTAEQEALTHDAVFLAMRRMKELHFSGIVLFNKPQPHGNGFEADEYLSERFFEMTGLFVEAAQAEKMRLWINDGFDCPTGNGGTKIREVAPHLVQRRIARGAYGKAEIREVEWHFPAFEEEESSRLFHRFVYEEYKKRFGQYFGKVIEGFFSDADNRRFDHPAMEIMRGEAYYPWSLHFGDLFEERFAYRIEPHLTELISGEGGKIAFDYWTLASDLYQAWFKRNWEWCKRNGLRYSFHTSDTGFISRRRSLRSSVYLEGSYLKLAEFTDYPGTDHELAALDGGTTFDNRWFHANSSWGKRPEQIYTPTFSETKYDLRAKLAGSAAHIYGKKGAMCELFAAVDHKASPQLLRRIAAWQLMQGITFFVPHAVHHRFCDRIKFFAPPEFASTTLRYSVAELNDWIAYYAELGAMGKAVFQGAVLEPVDEMFANEKNYDDEPFFELCEELNRRGILYAITDKVHAEMFDQIFEPGKYDELPSPMAEFDGGELLYLLRELENGERFLMAGNIRNDHIVSGLLSWNGRKEMIELEPGEIAVLGGPGETFRKPRSPLPNKVILNDMKEVRWEKENMVSFRQSAIWENTANLPEMTLLVSSSTVEILRLDGQKLSEGTPTFYYDDDYLEFKIPGDAGSHTLDFTEAPQPQFATLLCGNFAVEVETQNDFFVHDQNVGSVFLPEAVKVRLSPRPKVLHGTDWSLEGAPFYSGYVIYVYEIEGNYPGAELLAEVRDICELYLDGRKIAGACWKPYRFKLGNLCGKHVLELRICNSSANELRCLPLCSGLEDPPVIEFL